MWLAMSSVSRKKKKNCVVKETKKIVVVKKKKKKKIVVCFKEVFPPNPMPFPPGCHPRWPSLPAGGTWGGARR